MASQNEILSAMKMLAEYYGQEPNETQARLFMRLLEPYPGSVLEEAVISHIQASKWYPKVSEIRDLCDNLLPKGQTYQVDSLAAEQIELENEFYDSRQFDAERFERLALQYENSGRLARAEQVRRRAHNFSRAIEQEV